MSTHAGHAHDRATAAARSRPVLALTLTLTCAFMLVELVAAFWTGSLALLADAGPLRTAARPPAPRGGRHPHHRGRPRPGPVREVDRRPPPHARQDLRLLPGGDPGRAAQ